jgi:hypothetical protein
VTGEYSSPYFGGWHEPYSYPWELNYRPAPDAWSSFSTLPRQPTIWADQGGMPGSDKQYYPQIGIPSPSEYGAQYAHTNHYMRLSGWRNSIATASVTAVAEAATNNHPLPVVLGASLEFAQRYRHLNDNETAVFDVLRGLTQGGSIYRLWIAEDDLLDAMDSEMERDDRKRLLAKMKTRGLLEEGAGQWRAVF